MKKLIALLLALAMVLGLAACSKKTETATAEATAAPTEAPTEAPAATADPNAGLAMRLGSYTATVAEVQQEYESFVYYMTMYGLSAPTEEAEISEYVEMIVDSKIEDYANAYQADQAGITLTEDEIAMVGASVNTQKAKLVEAYEEDAKTALGDGATEEEIAAKGMELLEADCMSYMGCSLDEYMESYRTEALAAAKEDKLKESVLKDVAVTDEEVTAWYTDAVAADKASVEEDVFAFRTAQEAYDTKTSDAAPFYVPAGFVRAQVIEVTMETEAAAAYEENKTQMTALEAEYGLLALNGGTGVRGAEIRTEYKALAAANEELTVSVKEKAAAIHEEALTSNMTFSALSMKYNETLTEETAENGAIIYTAGEDSLYPAAVTAAVAALGDGEISEVIECDGTFYIVRRVAAFTEGEVGLENVKDYCAEQALAEKKETVWTEATATYLENAKAAAEKYPENYALVGR